MGHICFKRFLALISRLKYGDPYEILDCLLLDGGVFAGSATVDKN